MSDGFDVLEPLPLYRDVYRDAFAANAEKFFDDLTAKAGVDAAANAETVAELRKTESALAHEESARAGWGWGIALSAIAAIGSALGSANYFTIGGEDAVTWGAGLAAIAVLAAALLFGVCVPRRREHAKAAAEHKAKAEEQKAVAWSQMAPLNALFDWDIPARIIEKTVPLIRFDPFFTQGRLGELHKSFGWDDAFNNNKSVLGAHSGEINGNPFVFARLLQMEWGEKTYSGSRTVSWTETERGPDGKLRRVTRYQTLTATVTKPIPEYSQDVLLIYGNDAAPNLCFSREPTGLSSSGDGFFSKMRLKREIRSLEKFSRNLDDDNGYTIMGNREFEALFQTKDRSDEVEYRLLFTPLAQKQMLELIKDKKVGYGDDFSFLKYCKINVIRASHLAQSDLNADPAKFADYDFEATRRKFLDFCGQFFKSTWFAMAPLLSIPLYSQMRTHENIYKDVLDHRSCFWEHEALANYMGEERFRNPESVTRNILKTYVSGRNGDVASINVTASGFRIEHRVDTVIVVARNGVPYRVDVPWDEYIAVSKTTPIRATEREGLTLPEFRGAVQTNQEWQDFFRNIGSDPAGAIYRRAIISIQP